MIHVQLYVIRVYGYTTVSSYCHGHTAGVAWYYLPSRASAEESRSIMLRLIQCHGPCVAICVTRDTTNCSCGTALWCTPTRVQRVRVRVHYSCSHRLTVPPTWSLQESTAPLADVCSTPVCLGMRRHICPDVQHARHLGTCIWQLTRQVHMHAPDALTHRAQNGL